MPLASSLVPGRDARSRLLDGDMGDIARKSSKRTSHLTKRTKMGEIIDKVKGKVKRAAGFLVGNKPLEAEGRIDSAKGDVKGVVEDLKHSVKDPAKR